MSGSPRSDDGSSVTSPSHPTASPAAGNSHLQQHQQQQYQQQPMYGMPLSNQSVHAAAAAASAATAAATAATTAAAAIIGSTNQPGQQSGFVPTGPYQYQGAYQPTNLQQRVDAAVSSLNQMFPSAMSLDGSSYQRGQSPQGSDRSNNSFSFVPGGQGQQASQGSQMPSLYQLQSADDQKLSSYFCKPNKANHRGQVRRRRDYERRGGSGRQLKLLAHGATGATGTRATGATGTLATGEPGTRATGVTGSAANSERQEQRTHGRLEQRAHGRLAQRAHGQLAQRSHERLELLASQRPPPFILPKLSHPHFPHPLLPHTHPPQRQLQQWETREEEEQGEENITATPTPVTPMLGTPHPSTTECTGGRDEERRGRGAAPQGARAGGSGGDARPPLPLPDRPPRAPRRATGKEGQGGGNRG
ncbi:unnamed protein product [Closterium sp. NIES-54]